MAFEQKDNNRQGANTRVARLYDLPSIVALLADDKLGRQRESIDESSSEYYQQALDAITADENADWLAPSYMQLYCIGKQI